MIQTPNGDVYQETIGTYLGLDKKVIISIKPDHIEVSEISDNGEPKGDVTQFFILTTDGTKKQ